MPPAAAQHRAHGGGAFPPATGWNTWDVRHHTAWVHLPDGLRIRPVALDAEGGMHDGVTWRHGMTAMGPHTIDGGYADTSWQLGGARLRLRGTAAGSGLTLLVTAAFDAGAQCALVVDASPAAEPAIQPGGVSVVAEGESFQVRHGEDDWTLRVVGAAARLDAEGRVLVQPAEGGEFAVELVPGLAGIPAEGVDAPTLAGLRAAVDAAAAIAAASEVATSGRLGEAGQAMSRAITWNTIYAPDLGRVLTPTSRDFVSAEREGFYGSWAVHAWDTFFTALIAATIDQNLASTVADQILRFAQPDGMLPNRVSDDRGSTTDRSQPPVGAITLLHAYRASALSAESGAHALLDAALPGLVRWHDWWPGARRGPFGLLTWGSDPVVGDPESATMDRARRESGLDDSPMYDEVELDPVNHTLDLADVGLNALHVADARALAEIAAITGDRALEERMRAEADTASALVDEVLWSEEHGLYLNRWADGRFSTSVSPTLLYPLLAGIPGPERARAVAERLLRPEVLGGSPPLPSVARDDPGFDSRYWRGRIWAPLVYLGVSGLRSYGFDDLASPVVDELLELFLTEWRERSSVRENYPSFRGEDVTALEQRSDAFMAWGGLLGLLAIGEIARADADGWRFADPGYPAGVVGLQLAEGTLAVDVGERLTVRLNGELVVSAPAGSVLTAVTREPAEFHAQVAVPEGADSRLRVAPPPGSDWVTVTIDGESRSFAAVRPEMEFAVPTGRTSRVAIVFEGGAL